MRVARLIHIAAALILGWHVAARAQPPPTPPPAPVICGQQTLSASTSSSNLALLTPVSPTCNIVTVLNDGANEGFVAQGGSSITATTSDIPVPAGAKVSFWTNQPYVAGITISGSTTLRVIQANGSLSFSLRNNGGSPPTPAMSFTSLPSGLTSSSVPISGGYSVAAPSGLTNATYGGGCTGAGTLSGFGIAGSTWNATVTTPASPCTGTLTVTGLTPNTASATSPSATFATSTGIVIGANTTVILAVNTGVYMGVQ